MGTTVADTPIETGFDHAPRMERLADVGFFGGDVKVGLEKVRMRLLDLSKRNRLLDFKHPKSCLRAIDELPDQIFRKLIEGKGLSINPVSIPNPNRLASEVRERLEELRGPELLKYAAEHVYGIDTSYELPKPDPDGPAEARHIDNYLQTYQFPEPLEATVVRFPAPQSWLLRKPVQTCAISHSASWNGLRSSLQIKVAWQR
jgi:Protein of unknown function (DUF4011)